MENNLLPVIIPENHIIACPHPFSMQRISKVVAYGQTIQEILNDLNNQIGVLVNAHVFVDDVLIPSRLWDIYKPYPGAFIIIRVVPMGGEGKNPLRTIAFLALMIASLGVTSHLLALQYTVLQATLIGAGVSMLGSLLIDALIPLPTPGLNDRSGRDTSQGYTLSQGRNSANPYGPIPCILGKHRVIPPLGAMPYTEVVGSDQYLRQLFVIGYGPLSLSEFKIGETDVENFEDVEMEIREGYPDDEPLTLFVDDIYQENFNILLLAADDPTIRTTQTGVDEISVDVTFPTGLVRFSDTGTPLSRTVEFEIRYAPTGTSEWSIGEGYEAIDAQQSDEMPAPPESGLWYQNVQYCRVVINKYTGGVETLFGIVGRASAPPLVPEWAVKCALIFRREDLPTVTSQFVTDERDDTLDRENPDDFIPSVTDPVSTKIDIAAGGLRAPWHATGQSGSIHRITRRYSVPNGQYDIRIQRKTADAVSSLIFDKAYWTALRSITHVNPVQKTGLAMVAIRIKATNQLHGIIDAFNCIAHTVCDDWNSGTSTWIERVTNNPASLFRHILQGPANKKALADSRINLTALQTWHDRNATQYKLIDNAAAVARGNGVVGIPCTAHGFVDNETIYIEDTINYNGKHYVNPISTVNEIVITAAYIPETFAGTEVVYNVGKTYNHPVDFKTSIDDILREVCAAGRASPSYIDGKFTVVEDYDKSTIVQHFTPRNSWGFSSRKLFVDLPHALRVRFLNEDTNWEEDERIVYADEYDEDTATLFEQIEFPGVTNSDFVWKQARYYLAAAKLRPEVFSWYADVEHIVCTRGDLIRVSYDAPLWGLTWGRVKAVQTSGGNVTGVTMDEEMPMEVGEDYAIRFRKKDGVSVYAPVNTVPGVSPTIVFTTPILIADGPEVGDLGLYGLASTESVELVIKSIEPAEKLTARIVAVDAASAVHTADSGIIPDYDPHITPPFDPISIIGVPTIGDIRSDESVLIRGIDGSLRPRILITFIHSPGSMHGYVDATEVEYYLHGTTTPIMRVEVPYSGIEASLTEVESGQYYDIRYRYLLHDGRGGLWETYENYLVIGLSTPPPDVDWFTISGTILTWKYPVKPLDWVGFELRFHNGAETRSWESATKVQDGLITTTFFDVSILGTYQKTFLLKAVDVAGNYSENAAILITDLGDPLTENVVIAVDFEALNFPGTITNGSIVGDDIVADATASLLWSGTDTSPLWSGDDAALLWTTIYKQVTYEFEYYLVLTDPIEDPGTPLNNPSLKMMYSLEGVSPVIEYRTTGPYLLWTTNDSASLWTADADLLWSAATDWTIWFDLLGDLTPQLYQFRIIIQGGRIQGKVLELALNIDVPDINEVIEDFTVGTLGSRLPVTEPFIKIRNVSITLQDDGGPAIKVTVADKLKTGPLIYAYNSIGSKVSALIDARIQGY